jgi:hypothetical protein
LRFAIDRGRIAPLFVSATSGATGRRRTLYVDVEGSPHICATSDAIEALANQRWSRVVWTIREWPRLLAARGGLIYRL